MKSMMNLGLNYGILSKLILQPLIYIFLICVFKKMCESYFFGKYLNNTWFNHILW